MLTVRVNPKRQRESLVLSPQGPVLRITSRTGSKLQNTPIEVQGWQWAGDNNCDVIQRTSRDREMTWIDDGEDTELDRQSIYCLARQPLSGQNTP